jgi:pilus assembly protein CpaF
MTREIMNALHLKTMDHLDLRNTGIISGGENRWKELAGTFIERELESMKISPAEREGVRKSILDEMFGYGPISSLLEDPDISEVMVVGKDTVYVECKGRIRREPLSFSSDTSLYAIIDRIVSAINRRLDESTPFADARLPDGSRVNAIIPPVSLSGPCLTIRKFRPAPYTMSELVSIGALSTEAAAFLETAVVSRANIIISGGTGSGKTTMLNALSEYIPDHERIITIEDAAEIRLSKPHVVRLESRPPNVEGTGEITIRDLVRNSLRMRPDRIIVGECRGSEAIDMLQAMNTGHDGSITTGHANTPRDMLRRLETMVLVGGIDIPLRAIRDQVASAIDLVVHVSRMPDGRRAITSITEVAGIGETQLLLQELFTRESRGRGDEPGELHRTGIRSRIETDGGEDW